MKNNFSKYLLLIAIAVAIVTRFYKLGEVPSGFYVDEAGQGYSAYSILKTGRDEFGKVLPAAFRSLTDFKTPIYIYLIVPLIPIFGLTPFAVRFPSFFFSILTFPVFYLLIKELLPNRAIKDKKHMAYLPGFASLLLSISPWHILFGRTNFECNVALFFLLSGILTFYKSMRSPKFLTLSAALFAIALPAYHSQRIIVPAVLLVLFVRHKKEILSDKLRRPLIAGLLIGLIILLPTILIATTPGFLARASGLNIFSHSRQMPDGYIFTYQGLLSPIINGSWFLSVREFFSLYFSYFSPKSMFLLGDYGERSSFPGLSTFFMWQFPFYLWGFYTFVKNKKLGELKFIIMLLLIVSPIPAAVTRDPYTTIRALPLVIPQIFIIGYGILDIYSGIRYKSMRVLITSVLVIGFIYSLLKLYSSVIVLNEYYRSKAWDWGYKETLSVLERLDNKLPVIMDNARTDPELIIAFFLKYPPDKYQSENYEVGLENYYLDLKRIREKHVGLISTRGINWQEDLVIDQYLIGDELAISLEQIKEHKLKLIEEIKYPDGKIAFRIIRTNPQYEKSQKKTILY